MIRLNNLSKNLSSFTYTSIATNGDMSDGTTGYNKDYGTLSAADNILTATASVVDETQKVYAPNPTSLSGEKLYLYAKVRVTNSDCASIALIKRTVTLRTVNSPTINEWYEMYGITTEERANFQIQHVYANGSTANGKVMQIKEVFAINLTTLYGTGKEPVAADCLNIFRFVNGTKQPSFSKALAT